MKKHRQTQSEWENIMAIKILSFLKSEIIIDLPFLNIALSSLPCLEKEEIQTFATNGRELMYPRERLLQIFKKNTLYLERLYLHSILHCIFLHLWTRGKRDIELWYIACDISVEYTIDHMDKPCTKRILSYLRIETYKDLEQLSGITAPNIYLYLLEKDRAHIEALKKEFYGDDHRFWPKEEQRSMSQNNDTMKQWQHISRQTSMNKKRGEDASEGDMVLFKQVEAAKSKRSYKEFLKKFSIVKEELKIDDDTFDLSYYTYGLRKYGNMPLIEPMETKEVKKIREFVIVLDTSYSTSGTLIENFIKETYAILLESDSFFTKTHLRIIQCDDSIKMDEVVTSRKEMEALLNKFTILGGGGTDFRPAFRYVNQLIEEGVLRNLSGLLYFTDGKGIYPQKRPSYPCAFVFLEPYDETKVPSFAIRMQLDKSEFI